MNISQSQPSPTPVLQQSSEVYAPQKSDNGIIVLYVFILLAIMVIVAHYAGFNILTYLGELTNDLGDKVLPIWEYILVNIGYKTEESAKNVVSTSASGTGAIGEEIVKDSKKVKKMVDEDDSSDGGVEPVDSHSPSNMRNKKQSSKSASSAEEVNNNKENESNVNNQRLENSELKKKMEQEQPTKKELEKLEKQNVQPNDSGDMENQKGWCLIGSYKGIRSCSKVQDADLCMSGDIFPNQDVCVNPNIRK